THEIADVDKKLGRRRKLRAEVLEDLAKDRDHLHNQEGCNRHRDANDNDRVGHGGLDLLAQPRAGFEEAGETVENLREQTAVLTGLHHAYEKPIKHSRMFRDRFVKSFAALHAGGYVTDDMPQALLAFWIALVIESSQGLDQRNAGLDHRGKLSGKKNEIGLFDRPGLLSRFGRSGFLLKRH